MTENYVASAFAQEMKEEYASTRKCLERIPESLYGYKPHPTSMEMGYLTLLVAEIPLWIYHTIKTGEIDFATFRHFELSTTEKLLEHYEDSFKKALEILGNTTADEMEETFSLKRDGKVLFSSSKKNSVSSSINHWVHHRGQLTVYMRMNEIAVPSIYGPSADDQVYATPGSA
ncbi:MAG: damage-inducible protein DinB [Chitinophagaceae bacterium]|nr:MAG: damage-inducible protein DinB [Chitinophagaceae bacterium]